jgi:hypothetical protein
LINRLWWAFDAGRAAERGDLRPTGQYPNAPEQPIQPTERQP